MALKNKFGLLSEYDLTNYHANHQVSLMEILWVLITYND